MVLSQLIINGIIAGAVYALIASSFSLVYNSVKFMDLSPGAIYAVGAFAAYLFNIILGVNIVVSVLLALCISIIVSLIINKIVYKPLRKGRSDNFTLLLASFGVFLAVTGFILLIFGPNMRTFGFPIEKGFSILGATITPVQITLIISALGLFVLLHLFMKYTKTGKAIRAVADDRNVASTLGINVERTISVVFIISALLAGAAGFLVALEYNLEHMMGFKAVLKGITASIVGGIGNIPAALIGGFLLGIVENLGIWYLPSGYKDAIAFVLLIVFLIFRPQGIFGSKTREEVSG